MQSNVKGMNSKKEENFSEWYTQVIEKAELIEYSPVSGCIILRPRSYYVWERIRNFLDEKIKSKGIKNVYFPLLIPEELLKKESKHVEGFSPEVAWVTEAGDSKLSERLAIRPTSETIMYDTYRKWIRSYRDLPLLLNQWANVIRWEFKNSVPFLRTREFLWQEGHTVFATKEESEKHAVEILEEYISTYENLLAVPVLAGRKTESEKFAGADTTYSIETIAPNGKAVQCATSHCLGQNFSKAFNIKFLDKNEESKFAWQNCWGFSTRSIGIMIMLHSDDKGLVLPPKVAMNKVVIVPIILSKDKNKVLSKAKMLQKSLSSFDPILDDREDKRPGEKFSYYEMTGVPLRIEIGPKELAKNHVVVVRRDNFEKKNVKIKDLNKFIEKSLVKMHKDMLLKAKKKLDDNIVTVSNINELTNAINNRKVARARFCCNSSCENLLKGKIQGVRTVNISFDQPKVSGKCFLCSKDAINEVLFGKNY